MPNAVPGAPRPLVVGFRSLKDKDTILRHTNLLRKQGIHITEDCSGKAGLMLGSPLKKRILPKLTTEPEQEQVQVQPQQQPRPVAVEQLGPPETQITASKKREAMMELSTSGAMSDHMSSCNSDYAPSSHSGNSSSSAFTD